MGYFLDYHGKSGNGLYGMAQTPSLPWRLHQHLKGNDAASLRRVAPSFLFIQATLRNVAAHQCSRLSDTSGMGGKALLAFPPAPLRRFRRAKAASHLHDVTFRKETVKDRFFRILRE